MVSGDDEQRDEALDEEEHGRVRTGRQEPGKGHERERAQDGGQRDEAGEDEHDGKDGDGRQRGQGRGGEEYAEAGGDAFASVEAELAGEHVAEDGAARSESLGIAAGQRGHEPGAHEAAEENGGAAFEGIEEEGDGAEAFAAGAQDIGGADVAAAHGADVLTADEAHEQIACGNGAQQVRDDHDNDMREHHNESEFSR